MKNPFAKKPAVYVAPKGTKIVSVSVHHMDQQKKIFLVLDSGEKVLVATQEKPTPSGKGLDGSSTVSV